MKRKTLSVVQTQENAACLFLPFLFFFLAQEHRNALAKYFWLACDFPPEPFYLDLRLLNFRRADLNYNFEL